MSTLVLDDAVWEQVTQATGGAMNACYQCGTCTATCPLLFTRNEPMRVRRMMREAQLGAFSEDMDIWLCATCKLCETRCPRGVRIVDVIKALRSFGFQKHKAPPKLEAAVWGIYEDGNPWEGRKQERAKWADGLGIKNALEGARVLLYVGCVASFDPRLQRVARAVAELLRRVDIDFGILGVNEKCCGDAVDLAGETAFLEELALENLATFKKTGAETVVALSPHCVNMFRNVYPKYGAMAPALHYTEFLTQLLDSDRLKLTGVNNGTITYHDPCYLGRYNGVYEEPRKLLEAIPGARLVEMKDTKENALCCGGGGGRMWLETGENERLSNLRVKQAVDAGAHRLTTSCPYCIQNFEDSAKMKGYRDLRVQDVAELLLASTVNRTQG